MTNLLQKTAVGFGLTVPHWMRLIQADWNLPRYALHSVLQAIVFCRQYVYYLMKCLDLEASEFRTQYVPLLDEFVSQRMQERWPLLTPQEW